MISIIRHLKPYLSALILTIAGVCIGVFLHTQTALLPKPPGELRVWVFDVGQGDAIFLETPTGEQVLIDGGRDATVLSKLGEVMWPWDRTIDLMIVTHPDADHVSGLIPVLERYEVKEVWISGAQKHTPEWRAVEKLLEDVPVEIVQSGYKKTLTDVRFTIISPQEVDSSTDANQTSLVTHVRYGATDLLFTGDATEEEETSIAESVGDIDVLQAGHHGSLTSTSNALLDEVRPEYVLISAGQDNPYGHPHPIILQRLADRMIKTWRTDQDGDLLIRSTGKEPMVTSQTLPF